MKKFKIYKNISEIPKPPDLEILQSISSAIIFQRNAISSTQKIQEFISGIFGFSISEFLVEDLAGNLKNLEIFKNLIEESRGVTDFEKLISGTKVLINLKKFERFWRPEIPKNWDFFQELDFKDVLETFLNIKGYSSDKKSKISKIRKFLKIDFSRLHYDAQNMDIYTKIALDYCNYSTYVQENLQNILEDAKRTSVALQQVSVKKSDLKSFENYLSFPNLPGSSGNFQKNLLEFNDSSPLILGLKPIENFLNQTIKFAQKWAGFELSQNLETIDMTQKMEDWILEFSRKMKSVEFVKSIFSKELKCANILKPIRFFNISELAGISNFTIHRYQKINIISEFIENLKSTENYWKILEILKNSEDVDKIWEEIQKLDRGTLEKITEKSKKELDNLPDDPPKSTVNLEGIFENTGILEFLKCAERSSLEAILEILEILKEVSNLKSRIPEFKHPIDYIHGLADFQKNIKSFIKETFEAEQSLETRRIREFEGFKNLEAIFEEKEKLEEAILGFLEIEKQKLNRPSSETLPSPWYSFIIFYSWEFSLIFTIISIGIIDFFNQKYEFIRTEWFS
ncbi:hypothetical protein B9Z55_003261 [Caenorhabditis nigoni]|uniref:Domain of unknown function WSN domain-containing protein n=1 Tax=Caenorhabditis nigoni TaxID=1611254 RepID=A0A2G5VP86_9PELO|nr:hypothetical protein B9Z55_003261 [Caenorhabditis nigoni]